MSTLSALILDWDDFGSHLGVARHIGARGQAATPGENATATPIPYAAVDDAPPL